MAYEDLTGKTVGKYKCIEMVGKRSNGVPIYKCECKDCGWIGDVIYSTIIDSDNHPKCAHKWNYNDWIGKDIGRYHVISIDHVEEVPFGTSHYQRYYFNVMCNRCGMPAIITDNDIKKDMKNTNLNAITKCSHNVDESKIVGMQFGKYKITKNMGRVNGRIIVEAVCTKCGFVKTYRINDLKDRANDNQEICTHKYTWDQEKERERSGEVIADKGISGTTMGKYSVIQFLKRDEYGHRIYYVHCNRCGWEGNMVDHNILASKDKINCVHHTPSNIWSTARLGYIYDAMVDRCYNPHNVNYPNYGAKGIGVCPEWYDPNDPNNYIGKRNFNKFAVTHGFTDSLSIDRIDPARDYSPNNVQFVTRKYNSIFRANVEVIHIIGNGIDIPATISGWGKILNIADGFLRRTFNPSLYPDSAMRYYYMVSYIVNALQPNSLPGSFVYKVYFEKPIGYDFKTSFDLYPTKKE